MPKYVEDFTPAFLIPDLKDHKFHCNFCFIKINEFKLSLRLIDMMYLRVEFLCEFIA